MNHDQITARLTTLVRHYTEFPDMIFDFPPKKQQPEPISCEQFGEIADHVARQAKEILGEPLTPETYHQIWNKCADLLHVSEFRAGNLMAATEQHTISASQIRNELPREQLQAR